MNLGRLTFAFMAHLTSSWASMIAVETHDPQKPILNLVKIGVDFNSPQIPTYYADAQNTVYAMIPKAPQKKRHVTRCGYNPSSKPKVSAKKSDRPIVKLGNIDFQVIPMKGTHHKTNENRIPQEPMTIDLAPALQKLAIWEQETSLRTALRPIVEAVLEQPKTLDRLLYDLAKNAPIQDHQTDASSCSSSTTLTTNEDMMEIDTDIQKNTVISSNAGQAAPTMPPRSISIYPWKIPEGSAEQFPMTEYLLWKLRISSIGV